MFFLALEGAVYDKQIAVTVNKYSSLHTIFKKLAKSMHKWEFYPFFVLLVVRTCQGIS